MSDARKTVLVVDDEPGMRDMLRWQLDGAGFATRLAVDGAEAIEIIARDDVDLVITDLTLSRATGLQLLQTLRRRSARPIVIVVTGFGTVETAVAAMKAGAADFLLKPFDLPQLLERIRELL